MPRIIFTQNNLLYYIGLSFAMISLLKRQTYWEWPYLIKTTITWLPVFCLTINLLRTILTFKGSQTIFCLLSFVLIIIVGVNTQETYRLYLTFALVWGAKGIPYKDILKMHLYVGALFCLLTLIGYKLGMLKGVESEMSILDRVSLSNFGYRYSFGYCWATDFASHVMFLILTFWYLKEGVFKNIDYLILMCITAFTLFYTDSRLVFLMIVAIILLSIYCKMIYRNKVTPGKRTFNLFLLLIPILASLSFWMVTNYNPVNPFWFVINALMTGRLNLCYDALKYVGISPFGQYYELIGSGQGEETNYIDISYIQLAVIYGIVFTLVVICLYMYISFRAYKRKDIVTAIIIVLVSVEALIAQHYMLLEFNPILLGLLAKHNYSQTLLYQKSI